MTLNDGSSSMARVRVGLTGHREPIDYDVATPSHIAVLLQCLFDRFGSVFP